MERRAAIPGQEHIPPSLLRISVGIEDLDDLRVDLADLQAEGKIRFVALSNVTQEHVERARKIAPIVSVQNRYSFADREWDYLVEYCEREGIGFIPWFPLAAGTVAGMVLESIAKKRTKTPKQIALAWLLKRSPVMLPIPETSSIQHLEENVAASSLQLSDEEYQELANVPESPPFRS